MARMIPVGNDASTLCTYPRCGWLCLPLTGVVLGALGLGALFCAGFYDCLRFVDLLEGRGGVVGDFGDHVVGVLAELDAADVADGGVEGAENEFGALEFDGAAQQGDSEFKLSHYRKPGGMDEIHLLGIHRARKIRRDDRGRAPRSARRML